MDGHLSDRDWFVGGTPSIADIALYAYTHSAGEKGGYDLARFPSVIRWCGRMTALPGYVGLTDLPE